MAADTTSSMPFAGSCSIPKLNPVPRLNPVRLGVPGLDMRRFENGGTLVVYTPPRARSPEQAQFLYSENYQQRVVREEHMKKTSGDHELQEDHDVLAAPGKKLLFNDHYAPARGSYSSAASGSFPDNMLQANKKPVRVRNFVGLETAVENCEVSSDESEQSEVQMSGAEDDSGSSPRNKRVEKGPKEPKPPKLEYFPKVVADLAAASSPARPNREDMDLDELQENQCSATCASLLPAWMRDFVVADGPTTASANKVEMKAAAHVVVAAAATGAGKTSSEQVAPAVFADEREADETTSASGTASASSAAPESASAPSSSSSGSSTSATSCSEENASASSRPPAAKVEAEPEGQTAFFSADVFPDVKRRRILLAGDHAAAADVPVAVAADVEQDLSLFLTSSSSSSSTSWSRMKKQEVNAENRDGDVVAVALALGEGDGEPETEQKQKKAAASAGQQKVLLRPRTIKSVPPPAMKRQRSEQPPRLKKSVPPRRADVDHAADVQKMKTAKMKIGGANKARKQAVKPKSENSTKSSKKTKKPKAKAGCRRSGSKNPKMGNKNAGQKVAKSLKKMSRKR